MNKLFPNYLPLGIGQLIYSTKPQVVRTILGSCISICMHNQKTGLAAICHAVYAENGEPGDTHYVTECVAIMKSLYQKAGVPPHNVIVKVFGGAFGNIESASAANQNVSVAINSLQMAGFRVIAQDVGGQDSRELYFNMENGEAFVRKLGA